MSNLTEAKTRNELIDPALKKAGWDVKNPDQVGLEIPVDGFDPTAWRMLEARLKRIRDANGTFGEGELPRDISDYALYRPNACPRRLYLDCRQKQNPNAPSADCDC